jgi:hypothetical protein
MKAMAIKQLQAANPELYNARAVDTRVLSMIKVDDAESLFAPPTPPMAMPGPDPIEVAKIQQKEQSDQRKVAVEMARIEAGKEESRNREDIEILRLAQSVIDNSGDNVVAMRTAERAKGLVRD